MFKIAVMYFTVAVAQGRDCSDSEIEESIAQFNAAIVDDAAQCATDSETSFVKVNAMLPNFDLPVVNDNSCASSACQSIFDAVDAFDIPDCDVTAAFGASAQSLISQVLAPIRAEWASCGTGSDSNGGSGNSSAGDNNASNGTGTSSSASVLSTGMAAMSVMVVMFIL